MTVRPPPCARALALAALKEWRQGQRFADAIIQRLLAQCQLEKSNRAFANELFYGTLRYLRLLDFWIDHLRSGALDLASRDLLRLGFYQLFLLRTPSHAAVFETVELSGRRNRGLINGILRTALRRDAELRRAAETAPLALRTSHPDFLVERWQETFGAENARALCQWNNEPAPIHARFGKDFIRMEELPSEALARGECYIQDPSTAMSCELLDPQPGERVLDACAAPGGKTGLIATMIENRGQLVACDRAPTRVDLLRENLRRLRVEAEVLRHNWREGTPPLEPFDRILVDAPCTNTGVLRRRVDARWRLTSDDFLRMQNEQLLILRAVVPLLKPGGVLVYSTCSLESEENDNVVQQILFSASDLNLEIQKSVFPFRDHFDGAFAAKLTRSV